MFFYKKRVVRYKVFKTENKGFFRNRSYNYQKIIFLVKTTLHYVNKVHTEASSQEAVRSSTSDYKIESSEYAEFRK